MVELPEYIFNYNTLVYQESEPTIGYIVEFKKFNSNEHIDQMFFTGLSAEQDIAKIVLNHPNLTIISKTKAVVHFEK